MTAIRYAPLAAAALLVSVAAAAPAARADEKADALLKQVAAKTTATKTLSADLEMTMTRQAGGQAQPTRSTGTVKLMKPNFARITITGGPLAQTVASNGKDIYVLTANNQYRKKAANAQGRNIEALWAMPIAYFFNPTLSSLAPFGQGADVQTRYLGRQTVDGASLEAVAVSGEKPIAHTITLFIGPDKLFRRVRVDLKQGNSSTRYEAALKNIRVGTPMTAASFAYAPPKTAKAYEPPDFEAKLVPVGQKAPEFSLPTPTGGTLALADAVKGKKATVINFWFYG